MHLLLRLAGFLSMQPIFHTLPSCSMAATASAHLLAQLLDAEQMGCLCDVKEAGGQRYYRLNDDLVSPGRARARCTRVYTGARFVLLLADCTKHVITIETAG